MKQILKKYYQKLFWIILICLSLKHVGSSQDLGTNSLHSACNSYVVIDGTTNVNHFELKWKDSKRRLASEMEADTTFLIIKIPVKDFQANNSMMYQDFMELMKANEYPKIIIGISQDQVEKLKESDEFSLPEILITIAGVSNLYKIPCFAYKCEKKSLFLSGKQTIKLKDFNMKAPIKLQGLVKVKDEIDVNFGFIITFTESSNIVSR